MMSSANFSLPDSPIHPTNTTAPPDLPQYIYVVVAIFNVWVFLQGTIGNILVISVLLRKRIYMDSTDAYLLSLSTADLLILLLCQPTAMVEFYARDEWYFGLEMCRLVPFVNNVVCTGSVLSMVAISWERYHAIRHPIKSHYKQPLRQTLIILAVLWLLAGVVCIPFPILAFVEKTNGSYHGYPVSVCRTTFNERWQRGYIIVMFVTFYVVPLVMTVFMYRQMCRTLQSSNNMFSDDDVTHRIGRRHQQVVRMFAAVIIVFFLCLLPFRIFSICVVFSDKHTWETLGHEGYANILWFARVMLYLNSAVNPVLYNAFSSKFRRALKSIICMRKDGGHLPPRTSI